MALKKRYRRLFHPAMREGICVRYGRRHVARSECSAFAQSERHEWFETAELGAARKGICIDETRNQRCRESVEVAYARC